MRVDYYLADQNPHRDKSLGITAYIDGLLCTLAETHPELECRALVSRSSFRPEGSRGLQCLPWRTDSTLARLLTDQLHPWFVRGERPTLWHYPKGHLPALFRPRGPLVGTVHDTILQHYADHYPRSRSRAEFAYWIGTLRRSIARFDLILTISEFSKRSIEAFAERHGIRCPPVRVTWLGARGEERAGGPLSAKGNHVLHFASALPHKRTQTLLQHWQVLQTRKVELPVLQLVGGMTPETRRLAESLPNVQIAGRLPDAEVEVLITSARALVLPSEIEGFGLPLVEAYYSGTPVIFVRDATLAELLPPGVPGSFELESPDSLAVALESVLRMPESQCAAIALRLRGELAWSICAERTLAGYREALL